MSSPTRSEPQNLDAPADLLTMAVTRSDDSPAPAPVWATIEQVFAALESPLLIYARKLLQMIPDNPRRGLFLGRDYIIPRFMRVLRGEYQWCRHSGDFEQAARFLAEMGEIGSHLPEKVRVKLSFKILGKRIRAQGRLPRKWAIQVLARFKDSELGRQG